MRNRWLVLGVAAVVVLGTACSDPDPGPPDALDPNVARTDLVPAVGSEETIDVASWNLRMFPSTADVTVVAGDLIASLALDIVVLQEIESRAALDAMIARMPGWRAELPGNEGSATGGIAVAWRPGTVASMSMTLDYQGDPGFVRPVVRAAFALGGQDFVIFVVHLKAGTDPVDEQTRVDQMIDIETGVRTLVGISDIDRVLVMGDFNADFDDPRGAEVFAPWTADPTRYTVLTKALDDAGVATFLPASITLDHIVATSAFASSITEPAIVPPLDTQLEGYATTVSDHLPVILRLAR